MNLHYLQYTFLTPAPCFFVFYITRKYNHVLVVSGNFAYLIVIFYEVYAVDSNSDLYGKSTFYQESDTNGRYVTNSFSLSWHNSSDIVIK